MAILVVGNWLAQEVEGCTCAPVDYHGHAPMCGLEPLFPVKEVLDALRAAGYIGKMD